MQSSTVAAFGMLMVLEIAPEMKGCAAAIMRMWLSTERQRLPMRPHGLAQSNTAQMLGLQMRRAFERHRAAAIGVGGVDLGLGEAERRQQVEAGIVERAPARSRGCRAERFAQRPFVEGELDVEGRGERGLDRVERAVVEALGLEALVVDAGRAFERPVADRVALDRLDLVGLVAERRSASGTMRLMILK